MLKWKQKMILMKDKRNRLKKTLILKRIIYYNLKEFFKNEKIKTYLTGIESSVISLACERLLNCWDSKILPTLIRSSLLLDA